MKRCNGCGETMPLSSFYPRRARGSDAVQSRCRNCQVASVRQYRANHPGYQERVNRANNRRIRMEALVHYGGSPPRCACCGVMDLVFLALDHIHGGGNQERRSHPSRATVLRTLKRRDWPEQFRVLCHNCNWAEANGGCPHLLDERSPEAIPLLRRSA